MESSQIIAKRILSDLEILKQRNELNNDEIFSLHSKLESISNSPPPPPIIPRRPITNIIHPKFKAIWAYNGTGSDELTFSKGDIIEVIEKIDENWWKGSIIQTVDDSRSKVGLFPSNYVEAISNSNTPNVPSIPALPPRNTIQSSSSSEEEKQVGFAGYHSIPPPFPQGPNQPWQQPWQQQPGTPNQYWQGTPSPAPINSNSSYYNNHPNPNSNDQQQQQQPPMPYGGNTFNAYSPQSPPPLPPNATEEEKRKHEKYKKMAGKLGSTMANGFAGGVGFGIGSHLF